MLRCPVYLEALRRGDHSSTESYHMSKQIHNYIIDSDLQQVKSLIRKSWRRKYLFIIGEHDTGYIGQPADFTLTTDSAASISLWCDSSTKVHAEWNISKTAINSKTTATEWQGVSYSNKQFSFYKI